MIKDLSASLVAAAAAINAKTREAYVAEQTAIQAKKTAKLPQQPAPKAEPAASSTAKKMAEAVEGTVPKTPREKELAAKSGHPKRITFGDVLKARGVQKEEAVDEAAGWNPIKHIPKEKQTDAIKTAAKDVKRGSYADRAALLKAGGVKEGFMASMKKFGKKVVDTVTHGDDVDLIKDLQKKVGVPQTGVKPKPAKAVDTKPKTAHDYVKEEKEESAAHEKAEKKKSPWDTSGPSSIFNKEKSAFTSKKVSTGTVYNRKAVKEEIECIEVQHEQFGLGKTLGQFSEDLSEVDVMFAEGIKRVSIDDIEMVEETAAIHPSAIHVSPVSGGKYKVHAVGKKFASGIKVGEHLTDTHLDDFSEMGGKIKMVKAPKKA